MYQQNSFLDLPDENEQILNTAACVDRVAELAGFVNDQFGDDFAWTIEQYRDWADSLAAVHAAIRRGATRPEIVAAMSLLLVHPDSWNRLVAGDIKENQLQPWTRDARAADPVVYFASVIASTKADVPLLYASLTRDTALLLLELRLRPREGVAIAFGESGRRHLERNGFRRLGGPGYLNQYDFMKITARDARTPFWRSAFAVSEASRSFSRELDPYEAATSSPFP